MRALQWSLLASAVLHLVEEFVWPGGFRAWHASYRPHLAGSMSPPFLFGINALLLGMAALPAALGLHTPNGIAVWALTAGVVFSNGLYHLRATLAMRRYSPGVVTGVLLYVPVTLIGLPALFLAGADPATLLLNFALGCAYPLFSAWNHRRRAGVVR